MAQVLILNVFSTFEGTLLEIILLTNDTFIFICEISNNIGNNTLFRVLPSCVAWKVTTKNIGTKIL